MSPKFLITFAFATQILEVGERAKLIQLRNTVDANHPLAPLMVAILIHGRKLEQEPVI